jgi:hypothetical protein
MLAPDLPLKPVNKCNCSRASVAKPFQILYAHVAGKTAAATPLLVAYRATTLTSPP